MGTKAATSTRKPTAASARKQSRTGAADALFSKVQQRVLGVLFGSPSRSYYAKEIIGLAHSGSGAVQRELARLAESGLVTVTQVGRQKHYQANAGSPLFEELHRLSLKTFALGDVLRDALRPVAQAIDAAFVYGSIAKGTERASSDIDVLVISDTLAYGDLYRELESAGEKLGRKVSPTIYSSSEFAARLKRKNAFATRVMEQPKLWLIGDENVLGGMGPEIWRVLDHAHNARNISEYEGDLHVDDRLLDELIACTKKVLSAVKRLPKIPSR